ncbi:hypothetical protein VOLCADRAFT_120055 [Volvox carteri f. nagariensis]|uniref:MoaB/Mog domain-containing protein n=1 Tax=Volvox carteri f. nagariensis TaxID=3068 RepID=D8UJE1_VOLCA|nr:uncharacterized protein VOLCADRAFT_120055 [Volvox carteri f. nagariensis]EFJ40156.1 hypothetical protein VOLCADRAFT_120055 [Volvox carteri f. nagariensis]|eukprot:XP_002958766.1 hypothetical protein VOLCADRAFT_120055 [Volvox carteri f. nagariensis]
MYSLLPPSCPFPPLGPLFSRPPSVFPHPRNRSRGVDLIRVSYIPDSRSDIREAVLDLRGRVGPSGFVFTSGGIGPTHDDVTYEAVAEAMGVSLQLHEPTVERMRVSYSARGLELNDARLRMATLPTPSEVLFTQGLWVPLVNLRGVYVLPGIPRLFQAMIAAHQERFTGVAFQSAALYTRLGESDLAQALTAVAAKHPHVAIGSYPHTAADTDAAPYKVKLAFTSRDGEALAAAVADVRSSMGDIFIAPPP